MDNVLDMVIMNLCLDLANPCLGHRPRLYIIRILRHQFRTTRSCAYTDPNVTIEQHRQRRRQHLLCKINYSIPPRGNYHASSGHQSGTGFDPAQMRKRPLEFIIAYERSKDKKKATETTSKKSRRLPRSLDDFVRRLLGSSDDFQTTLQEVLTTLQEVQTTLQEVQTTLSEDFQEVQTTSRRLTGRLRQKTSMKFRRLPGSPDDFPEVQTTSWKSRRLPKSPDDFLEVQTTLSENFQEVQTTSKRLPDD
ncbi:hypothetical protein Bca101_085379 [Brassica carinata]